MRHVAQKQLRQCARRPHFLPNSVAAVAAGTLALTGAIALGHAGLFSRPFIPGLAGVRCGAARGDGGDQPPQPCPRNPTSFRVDSKCSWDALAHGIAVLRRRCV
jgi:hypothetical protein